MSILHHKHSAVLASPLLVLLLTAPIVHAQDSKPHKLTPADRTFLDGLFEFLFDPTGARRVEAKIMHKSREGRAYEERRIGWHVAAKSRVFIADGSSIPAPPPDAMSPIDFVAACKARLAEKSFDPDADDWDDRPWRDPMDTDHDVALAAWLHRLGHEELAARMLARARTEGEQPDALLAKALRHDLAENAYHQLAFSFVGRADADAMEHAERYFKLHVLTAPEYDSSGYQASSKRIVAELQRRRANGTFGKQAAKGLPIGYSTWDPKRKLEYLIDRLEDVDEQTWDVSKDPRVAALVALGDSAVPRLVDVIEKDKRLTHRLQIFDAEGGSGRFVVYLPSVQETAFSVLQLILRTNIFDVSSPAKAVGRLPSSTSTLRAYVKKYLSMPFDERMMKIVTDPKATPAASQEAAANLANLNAGPGLPTTHLLIANRARPKGPYPVLARFKDPTTAEAMLAALDREAAALAAGKNQYPSESFYLGAIITLGDTRITPKLAQRAQTVKSTRSRLGYAEAAHWLGDSRPIHDIAEECRLGTPRGDAGLHEIVATLVSVADARADEALYALAAPKHPWYRDTYRAMVVHGGISVRHPYCLPILRRALDDYTSTGTVYKIKGKWFIEDRGDVRSDGSIPDELKSLPLKAEAGERCCDAIGSTLGNLVVGLPVHYCLFKDADANLQTMRDFLDRFAGCFRVASPLEQAVLGWGDSGSPNLVPAFPILDRPATAADVKSGHAVFHLDGQGKRADKKLPLVGELKPTWQGTAERVLIVQAEQHVDGEVVYGVIARHSLRAVPDRELTRVLPLDAKQWQVAR
jgi:hypothetical protein